MVGQDLRPLFRDSDGVLKVCGYLAVGSHHSPLVIQDASVPVPEVQHRLYRDAHAGPKKRSHSRLSVIRNLGVFVEEPPYSVAHKLPHYSVASGLAESLYRGADVSDPITWLGGIDSFFQTPAGCLHKLIRFLVDLPHSERNCCVADQAIQGRADIKLNYIALFEYPLARDPVYDLFIYRRANAGRKPAVSFESGRRTHGG